ncbi:Enolase, C-terminal TIM barrel domain-containing protein [Bombardia bombarda]|uniref:phosphopyruvate hydratase n=1 Tax=Bombardia bombarda TaxID=252184 RepID=A0AA39U655_9PEZI|nr:Enolase, C-terminal TIM barrel domain-containing protein [Bombardia bombarda]
MIEDIQAAQRLDSRGNPTVQVDVKTAHGTFRALVPSGASTGSHEAVELRDTCKAAYGGKGVLTAVGNVRTVIGPALMEKEFDPRTQQKEIDQFMCDLDGTPDKSRLGANAILGVSMACARAGAVAADVPLYEFLRQEAVKTGPYVLPVPFFNVLNGGRRSGNTMAFQEIMVAPTGAETFEEGVRWGSEIYSALKEIITKKFGPPATGVGDEGGFAPPITHLEEALDLLTEAVEARGYTGRVVFGIDPASSEFFKDGAYDIGFKDKKPDIKTPQDMMQLYRDVMEKYPIALLEDPFAEDDWASWSEFNQACEVELVGDDLLCANVHRVWKAKERRACNSMSLKMNQIGTVSEAIKAAKLAKSFKWGVFVSHRSGEETTDDFIADLTVALSTGHLKSGAPCRGEHVAKYNRLMDIEAELEGSWKPSEYAGARFRNPSTYAFI